MPVPPACPLPTPSPFIVWVSDPTSLTSPKSFAMRSVWWDSHSFQMIQQLIHYLLMMLFELERADISFLCLCNQWGNRLRESRYLSKVAHGHKTSSDFWYRLLTVCALYKMCHSPMVSVLKVDYFWVSHFSSRCHCGKCVGMGAGGPGCVTGHYCFPLGVSVSPSGKFGEGTVTKWCEDCFLL